MATEMHTITAGDLSRMPDDGLRRELVQGEVREMTPAGHDHGRITLNITTPLDQYVRANGLGAVFAAETGFHIASDPDTVRAPDCAFVRRERLADAVGVEGFWPGAPDLAVEVVSPRDRYTEVEAKVFDWLDDSSSSGQSYDSGTGPDRPAAKLRLTTRCTEGGPGRPRPCQPPGTGTITCA